MFSSDRITQCLLRQFDRLETIEYPCLPRPEFFHDQRSALTEKFPAPRMQNVCGLAILSKFLSCNGTTLNCFAGSTA
jgi:hypothetical protein